MAEALVPGQRKFAAALASYTGLDPRVLGAWMKAEQSGSAARNYEGKGYFNWLNIARTDSGDASGSHSSVWRNPISAAKATAEWIKGQGQIAREYGKPAPGIHAILNTAGKGPQAQINAIGSSGWATASDYGSKIGTLYGELAGDKALVHEAHAHQLLNMAGGGGPAEHAQVAGALGAAEGGGAAQQADLTALLQGIAAPAQQGPSIGALAPPAPPGSRATPAPAPIQPSGPNSDERLNGLLGIVQRLGQDAPEAAPEASEPSGGAQLGTRAPQAGTPAGGLTSRKGIVDFGGHKVAAWIAPILHYVQQHGVTPQITSGYRSRAEQTAIYNSGVRPAAVPGTSNHEGEAFPRGAVDIANAQQVARVLAGSPYKGLLVYAGPKDPVHFSHPHGGGY